eukprot:UC1_evm1s60
MSERRPPSMSSALAERVAAMTLALEAARPADASARGGAGGSFGVKKYNWCRAHTISSSTPMAHKTPGISAERKEKFEQLDLDILLHEYRAAAEEEAEEEAEEADEEAGAGAKAAGGGAGSAAAATGPGSSSSAAASSSSSAAASPGEGADGEEERQWLGDVGLQHLADKVSKGDAITSQDIAEGTAGFTPLQVAAVADRASFLNATIAKRKKGGKGARGDAREAFMEPTPSSPMTPMAEETMAALETLTEDIEEPPTNFFSLSPADQQQVQYLALIQVTSLLEARGLKLRAGGGKRGKAKKGGKDGKLAAAARVFGANLSEMANRDMAEAPEAIRVDDCPIFFESILRTLRERGLSEEGLFRKAGSTARIKALRAKIEAASGRLDLSTEAPVTHDLCSVLKQFLREVRNPLLTSEYLEAFSSTQELDGDSQGYVLQLLVLLLPPAHRACLRELLEFLCQVASHSDQNKMGLANLAVVFAPTLFYVRGSKGQKMLKEVAMQVTTAATLKKMLEYNATLWDVPADILAQVRFMNESQGTQAGRRSGKALREKRRGGSKDKKKDKKRAAAAGPAAAAIGATAASTVSWCDSLCVAQDTLVQWVNDSAATPPVRAIVCVTLMSGEKKSGIEATDFTSARDVLEACGCADGDKATGEKKKCCLVEVGGNIGSRRLDPRTRIVALLRVNPAGALAVLSI